MINKVYAIYVALSSKDNHIYIMSTDETEIKLPIKEILLPHKIKQESRYIFKNFFEDQAFQFAEECSYNFLDLQEDHTLDYIKNNNLYDDNNLYITYGGIAPMFDLKDNLYWYKLIFNHEYFGYTNNKPLNLLIDNVINKSVL